MKIVLNGVAEHDRLSGFIKASEFKKNWEPETLFQWYQRARVEKKRKIESLKETFKNNGRIDGITVNLIGDFEDKGDGKIVLKGALHVVDGQQRLCALVESDCDYSLPVVVHYNLTMEQEVDLFEKLNRTQTKLSTGEHVNTCKGPFADRFREVLNSSRYPLKVTLRGSAGGLSASAWCALLHWAHHRLNGVRFSQQVSGGNLVKFMEKDVTETESNKAAVVVRRLLEKFVEIYGTYSPESIAYTRGFMMCWCHVVINNFVTSSCSLDTRGFEGKLDMRKLLHNSYVRELIGGSTTHPLLYDAMVKHLNHKKRTERLPNFNGVVETPSRDEEEASLFA